MANSSVNIFTFWHLLYCEISLFGRIEQRILGKNKKESVEEALIYRAFNMS